MNHYPFILFILFTGYTFYSPYTLATNLLSYILPALRVFRVVEYED